MRILVLNAGSSSLKASVVDPTRGQSLTSLTVGWGSDATRQANRAATVETVVQNLAAEGFTAQSLSGVGHRFVHGGPSLRAAVLLDEAVLDQLGGLLQLAPLHNGVALDTIVAARSVLPALPHAAAFDTAFHADLPPAGHVYPLPWQWYAEWGIRRYGFHGLSVAWAVQRSAELLDRPVGSLRVIVAHLGSGCSVTAVDGGRSVATSMGLTPLEGLMMGTRSGSVDPGILLGLLADGRLGLSELRDALDHAAGLLGVSGVSGDVREVSRAALAGNERAALALDLFARRAAEGIGAAATALPAVDGLVFTGGIGENAGELRARIVGRLAAIGVDRIGADEDGRDRLLSQPDAAVAVLRVEAREDHVIAAEVAALLEGGRH